jgi:23S rRNA (cytidine1920-2'-O)/16S rRNA (cytidine1409-2'-O)-methyltransferase
MPSRTSTAPINEAIPATRAYELFIPRSIANLRENPPVAKRVRLDQLLVQRELAPSRERAQALILAGAVRVDGDRADRAAAPVAEDAQLAVDSGPRYVSRGGDKLAGALDDFGLDVSGSVAIDVGSSTGGFTDVLLQRGAARVHAIDVGKGQLDWGLRNDPRVVVHEGVNAREGVPVVEPVDLVVADVSFISLRLALPPALAKLREQGDLVALVKPQFEAGREAVGKGGVVRDPAVRADAVIAVARDLAGRGVGTLAIAPSATLGREGNREIFIHGRKGATGLGADELEAAARKAAE